MIEAAEKGQLAIESILKTLDEFKVPLYVGMTAMIAVAATVGKSNNLSKKAFLDKCADLYERAQILTDKNSDKELN
jgi:hypothetical protein